jgi:hypothetical protein
MYTRISGSCLRFNVGWMPWRTCRRWPRGQRGSTQHVPRDGRTLYLTSPSTCIIMQIKRRVGEGGEFEDDPRSLCSLAE